MFSSILNQLKLLIEKSDVSLAAFGRKEIEIAEVTQFIASIA